MPYQFSDALDDELLYERGESFGGGMDAFSTPSLLPADAWQYGLNIVVPDNLRIRTRAGADTLTAAPAGSNAIQGLRYFDTNAYEQLIAGANSKLWKWEGSSWAEMTGWTLNDASLQFASAQGVDKLLITDGVQNMRSWDGATFTNLGSVSGSVSSDPPVGATILCWHTARMFASGQAAANDTVWASALLDFTSSKWNHVNFSFRVGAGDGDAIKAIISLPPAGPDDFRLAVLKANSIYTVNTDPTAASAAAWSIQAITKGIGCVGRFAVALSGNDVLFMARDGVRSLRRMASAAGQYELSPPLSTPLQPYIDRINWTYAHLIAAVNYKHLTLFSVPLDSNTTNNTVLVWNGRIQRWTGIWTGWTVSSWEVSRFADVLRLELGETTGLVRRWKDVNDATADGTYTENNAAIASKLWTRAMLFGEAVNDKDGYHAEARFSQGNAVVTLTAIGDGSECRTWSADMSQSGVNLPVDLPFDLPSAIAQRPVRRGLRGCTPFNELFLKIESTSGWWELKNWTVSAYLNMLQNQGPGETEE